MTPRNATTNSERSVELAAGDAYRLTVSEKVLTNLTTLLIGCPYSRNGLSAALGRKVPAASAIIDLCWDGLLRESLAPQLLLTLLHLLLRTFACTLLLYYSVAHHGALLRSALYGCRPLWLSTLHGCCWATRNRAWCWWSSCLSGSRGSGG